METPKIYHEKQSKELCAIHALNNIFQKRTFTQSIMDEICSNLAPSKWINPHRSVLGLGNYDINVIMTAVQVQTDCEVIWFDKRKDPNSTIEMDKVVGFLLNIPSTYDVGGLFTVPLLNRRHWIALKKVEEIFYNLDSKLKKPEAIGGHEDVIKFIQNQLQNKDNELFLIVKRSKEGEAA